MDDGGPYAIVGAILGVVAFFGCWAYAIYSWGFLLGVGLGWIPSIFIGLIAFAVGPFLLSLGILLLIGAYALNKLGFDF